MKSRRLWYLIAIVAVILATLPWSASFAAGPNPPGAGKLKFKGNVTPAEQQAAGARFQQQFQAAVAAGTATAAAAPDPGGKPHYFGPYPNWANSPLPRGVIAAITLDAGGSGYTTASVEITDLYYGDVSAIIDPTTGSPYVKATATATVTAGAVTAITIDNPGSGYSAPVVTITAGGAGAAATATVASGGVESIVVVNGGANYVSPTVTITPAPGDPGTGATASATVVGGVVDSITVVTPGSGYTTAPTVVITDTAPGSGAAATATIGGPFSGGIKKFVDKLPGLGPDGGNNLGQYIPVAVADTTTYPGSDYYEIAVVEFEEQMHSDLPPTRQRGYVQLGGSVPLFQVDGVTPILMPNGTQAMGMDKPHFLGPTIVAQTDRAVRIKFYNLLPTGTGGDLFLPVDKTVMGSGMGPVDMPGMPGMKEEYTQNRATLHLHGNDTIWISDGTPHQWITPADETTSYPQGVSVVAVPDMNAASDTPTDGSMTFYYTNQQSARLMFYHDHSYGITRLNVYAGEAAGYVITDQVEQDLINGTNTSGVNPDLASVLPDIGIPLVIQDRTFVDKDSIGWQDPTWAWGTNRDPVTGAYLGPKTGDLWYPHVYMPVQNPGQPDGINPFGRWHYAAWFWPPADLGAHNPIPNPACLPDPPTSLLDTVWDCSASPWEGPFIPGLPDNSSPGEAFMDTPTVNGTAYPYMEVDPKAYRFRILNAADDRFFNLQWYVADEDGYISPVNGYPTEVRLIPDAGQPSGIVADPSTKGPDWIQIGTEGGFLPKPVVIPAQPTMWNLDQTTFNFGNVTDHSLLLGTAERADVIVDFSQFAGKTLILYNDTPAPFPAYTPQYDYYTGAPNLTDTGGVVGTEPGYGPNTRTIMQVRVKGTPTDVVGSVALTSGGAGYTAPTVGIVGDGTGATATATGSVDRVALTSLGTGYTAPVVAIDPPATGTQATAVAAVKAGVITGITVTNPGSGYTSAPNVTITDSGTPLTVASAKATLTLTGLTLDAPGSGYTAAPIVAIWDASGTGAGAAATAALAPSVTNPAYSLAPLEAAFAKTDAKRGVFEVSQDPVVVPSADYNSAYNKTFPVDPLVRQAENSHTYQNVWGTESTVKIEPKALQDEMSEVFDEYGRMMVMEGLELPMTTAGAQNFQMYPYASPPVEVIKGVYANQIGATEDGTQIWKITHNGVDTHTIHTHLFNAQLINRVAWDGKVIPPDPNELGWKETFRVNPLEHTIIALRAVVPDNLPFDLPNSKRLLDPTSPAGTVLPGPMVGGFMDPMGNPVTVTNHEINYGWEYVYHCHILAHEEMDMMHSVVIAVAPKAPTGLEAARIGNGANRRVVLNWTDNSANETGFTVERATDSGFTAGLVTFTVGPNVNAYTDPIGNTSQTFYYRVFATNTVGDAETPGFPTITTVSGPTNVVTPVVVAPPAAPSNLRTTSVTRTTVALAWNDNSNNETGFRVQRATNAGFTQNLVSFPVGANITSYTDNSVAPNTRYWYRVVAFNVGGDSGPSNTINLTTPR